MDGAKQLVRALFLAFFSQIKHPKSYSPCKYTIIYMPALSLISLQGRRDYNDNTFAGEFKGVEFPSTAAPEHRSSEREREIEEGVGLGERGLAREGEKVAADSTGASLKPNGRLLSTYFSIKRTINHTFSHCLYPSPSLHPPSATAPLQM
jgi:hypothetical protein